ncbi:hypothetical protein HaLaN_24114, partial [Haematococcus lacustris]
SPSATPVTVLGSQAGFNQSTGIASVTFNATAAGTYAVAVFVAGVRLTTGLASLVVASGPLDVPACELSGSATVVNCGEVFNLLVLARDAFDNDLGASPLASRVTNVAGILTTVAWSYTVDNSPLVAANISISATTAAAQAFDSASCAGWGDECGSPELDDQHGAASRDSYTFVHVVVQAPCFDMWDRTPRSGWRAHDHTRYHATSGYFCSPA